MARSTHQVKAVQSWYDWVDDNQMLDSEAHCAQAPSKYGREEFSKPFPLHKVRALRRQHARRKQESS